MKIQSNLLSLTDSKTMCDDANKHRVLKTLVVLSVGKDCEPSIGPLHVIGTAINNFNEQEFISLCKS
jgi:hypothetical protein